jgi:hypothetical protein
MSQTVDLYVLYKIIKSISTPYNEMDAFKLGIIDERGRLLKSPKTQAEREAYNLYDRFVVNIKRILGKAGLDSRIGTYAGALFLIKESHYDYSRKLTDSQIKYLLEQEIDFLKTKNNRTLKDMIEDAPANATGAAVAGTGDDPVHWRKLKLKGRPRAQGKAINGYAFLRRMNRQVKQKIQGE